MEKMATSIKSLHMARQKKVQTQMQMRQQCTLSKLGVPISEWKHVNQLKTHISTSGYTRRLGVKSEILSLNFDYIKMTRRQGAAWWFWGDSTGMDCIGYGSGYIWTKCQARKSVCDDWELKLYWSIHEKTGFYGNHCIRPGTSTGQLILPANKSE